MESSIRFGGGRYLSYGDGSLSGSQKGHNSRSDAKSNIVSETIENSAGAGVDPKGSLVMIVPMNSSFCWSLGSFEVVHADMHLAAILGVVWRRRYALSKSDLQRSILLSG